MLTEMSAMAGFVGVAVSIVAYLPQIVHLLREHCSAGVSPLAFGLWLVSSCLVTIHAAVVADWVFIALGSVQIVASLLIWLYGLKYRNEVCASHAAAIVARAPTELTDET